MTLLNEIIIFALFGLIAFLLFLLARNEMVFRIRMAFLDDDELYPDAYKCLPRYGAMSDNPKHYLRWTKKQWIAYVREVA
jgi:hypothetical protein